MPLKAIVDEATHKTLPELIRNEYVLDDKTKTYRLGVEPVSGWALEDVVGLKTVLSERTEKHREAAAKLAALGDITPEQAKDAFERLKALGDMGDKRKLDEMMAGVTSQVEAKYKGEVERRDVDLKRLNGFVERTLVEAEAARLLSGATDPTLKGSYPLLIGLIRSAVRVEKVGAGDSEGFEVTIIDPKTGTPQLSQRQGNNGKMSLEEYLHTLRAKPEYAAAFAGNGASGGGSPGSGKGNRSGAVDTNLPAVERLAALRRAGAK